MLYPLIPWFGYLASLLLALGLLVASDLKFRWLNTAGNITFIVYSILLPAWPVLLTNSILLFINLYFLFKIYRQKEYFEILEFGSGGVLINRFLEFYKEDIALHFPDFKKEEWAAATINFIVLRDLVIAAVFSASVSEEGNAEVIINYTVPKYRDYKTGRFIFDRQKKFFTAKGVQKIFYKQVYNRRHGKFLTKMGFEKQLLNGKESMVKDIR